MIFEVMARGLLRHCAMYSYHLVSITSVQFKRSEVSLLHLISDFAMSVH